jgi:hypothetical protein
MVAEREDMSALEATEQLAYVNDLNDPYYDY